jgi:hypothetical protein
MMDSLRATLRRLSRPLCIALEEPQTRTVAERAEFPSHIGMGRMAPAATPGPVLQTCTSLRLAFRQREKMRSPHGRGRGST